MGRRYGGLGFRRGWGTLADCQEASESISSKESLPVSVVIRMKRMGRKNRAFYRICATDKRSPRDGRVIEEIGTYDPFVPDTDDRCVLNGVRLQHWLSVGALPSEAVRVLIKKYGPQGTHLAAMEQSRAKLSLPKIVPDSGPPAFVPVVKSEPIAAATVAEASSEPVAAEVIQTEVSVVLEAIPTEIPATEEPAGS